MQYYTLIQSKIIWVEVCFRSKYINFLYGQIDGSISKNVKATSVSNPFDKT